MTKITKDYGYKINISWRQLLLLKIYHKLTFVESRRHR